MKTIALKSFLPLALAVGTLACKLDPPQPRTYPTDNTDPTTCTATTVDAGSSDDGGSGGFVTVTPVSCNAANASFRLKYTDGYTPSPADQATVKGLMQSMSRSDKAWQMRGTQYGGSGSTQMSDTQRSYDVPFQSASPVILGYHYRDAGRGVNFAEDMNGHLLTAGFEPGSKTPVGWSTAFPVSLARGAAFDLDLEYAIGEAIGDEMMAAKETLLLAPCMNILRHPLWGRAQETYGEDSFQLGRLASAMTVGVQQHIAANAKHFMAYDIEKTRDQNNMTLDEQTLREVYGRHFRMAVQDGGVSSVMASYNRVNGEKATTSQHILTDVLRTDFGFQGFVLSDWWAMDPGNDTSRQSSYYASQAIKGVKAGLDIELAWSLNYSFLESIVQNGGGLSQGDIDTAAARILLQKVRFNSWNPTVDPGLGSPKTGFNQAKGKIVYKCDGHIDLANKAAVESMVLLKNSGDILPISSSVKKVAVVGATLPYKTRNSSSNGKGAETSTAVNFAEDARTGDLGSSRVFSDPTREIGPLKGIANTRPSSDIDVVTSSAPIKTVAAAQKIGDDSNVSSADFIVVVAGLTPEDEGEDYTDASDRTSFALDAKQGPDLTNIQNTLITSVAALGKKMVVVLEGGSVIDVPWLDKVPALVMAWYPGMVGGDAMGRLLWGQYNGTQYNFSGKLPITWGQLGDYGVFQDPSGSTTADYYLGYRLFDKNNITPVFPFGYGLSYTKFAYSNLQVGCTDMSQGAVMPVYVNVKNTGDRPGDEVVFLFVSFPNSKASRRTTIRELKGFARVSLAAGEEKQVMIPLRLKDLDYYDQDKGKWVVEEGSIKIMVGGDSSNMSSMLTGSVDVHGYEMASSNY